MTKPEKLELLDDVEEVKGKWDVDKIETIPEELSEKHPLLLGHGLRKNKRFGNGFSEVTEMRIFLPSFQHREGQARPHQFGKKGNNPQLLHPTYLRTSTFICRNCVMHYYFLCIVSSNTVETDSVATEGVVRHRRLLDHRLQLQFFCDGPCAGKGCLHVRAVCGMYV